MICEICDNSSYECIFCSKPNYKKLHEKFENNFPIDDFELPVNFYRNEDEMKDRKK